MGVGCTLVTACGFGAPHSLCVFRWNLWRFISRSQNRMRLWGPSFTSCAEGCGSVMSDRTPAWLWESSSRGFSGTWEERENLDATQGLILFPFSVLHSTSCSDQPRGFQWCWVRGSFSVQHAPWVGSEPANAMLTLLKLHLTFPSPHSWGEEGPGWLFQISAGMLGSFKIL